LTPREPFEVRDSRSPGGDHHTSPKCAQRRPPTGDEDPSPLGDPHLEHSDIHTPLAERGSEKSASQLSFLNFIRTETRFQIGGRVADEGTVKRLAEILGGMELFHCWRIRLRQWCRNNTPTSWGILVRLAEDVRAEAASLTEAPRGGRASRS
jgi:hypothetical protein